MLQPERTALERAFELAHSGRFGSYKQVYSRMEKEHYDTDRLSSALTSHLKRLISRVQTKHPRA